jgi:glutamate-1-semialdehyde 2,1-aminomutase
MSVKALSFARSQQLSKELQELIPGGVDSPFRSFKEVGGDTIFFERGSGSRIFDVDGNQYIDYLGAWGPNILGYCHADVVQACREAVSAGTLFGAPHQSELEMARALTAAFPSMKQVRFVNSGTEAVMSAIRLARGYTQRDGIIMFEGGYHGHSDSVLASVSHRTSTGIPEATARHTVLVPYNDLAALRKELRVRGKKIACVLIEPVCGSMGVVPPDDGYLQEVASVCREHDVLLIFDEVLTGLRVARGGAQALYGVTPDLTCLGKALGGGMPIGAFGGRQDIMQHLEPIGKVYQAGTFSGNPVTMAGGIKTLEILGDAEIYQRLEKRTEQLFIGLSESARRHEIPIQLQRVGSMFAILFAPHPVRNFKESLSIEASTFANFFHFLLENGIYLPPSSVDAACLSAAHTSEDIEHTIEICDAAFAVL